jgi:hypothetical protein
MPVRPRRPNEIARQVMPLLLLGIGLVASNSSFTIVDDEASSLGFATQPVRAMLDLIWSGAGRIDHPPLYEILLHFWLRLTGGTLESLRMPSILLYLAGLFLVARAAGRLGGPDSARAVAWLGVLWPFGFHYGRLASWYALSFFLVAGLTLAYLRYLEDQSFGRWILFLLAAVALLWTNYFGWAILGCLAIDQLLRFRAAERTASPAILVRTAALLCVAFLPLFRAFRNEFGTDFDFHHRALAILANAAIGIYSLFVSESVAPWYWFLSIPSGMAVLASVGLVVASVPRNVRRFLLYGALLIAAMAVSGILLPTPLLLVSPWILLPVGIAAGTDKSFQTRIALPVTLLMIGGIGWFGIYSRHYYSAPRFLEPWPQVAEGAAGKIRSGATVIANSPAFFIDLTYILHAPDGSTPWKFVGPLPDQVRHPQVKSPEEWLSAGHPVGPSMVWIRGMGDPKSDRPMDEAAQELGRACGMQTSRLMMRDPGYEWKQRMFPEMKALQWRVEVREYDCPPAGSPEIFHIPRP